MRLPPLSPLSFWGDDLLGLWVSVDGFEKGR